MATFQTHACSIPVFRYALENWEAETFQAHIFHEAPLTSEQQSWMKTLTEPRSGGSLLTVHDADMQGHLSDDQTRLWKTQKDNALPRLVVSYPFSGDSALAWAAPFDSTSSPHLLRSPARSEVARRILSGDSVVWVLVLGTDAKKSDEVWTTLSDQLGVLEKHIPLPRDDQPGEDEALREKTHYALPLAIRFSVLKVRRDDPDESAFVSMLTHFDPSFSLDQPVVFPIFGRGRALTGMSGTDLRPRIIEEAALFLTGACSCRFKELSPGTDIFFDIDWTAALEKTGAAEERVPPAVSVERAAPKSVEIPPGLSARQPTTPPEPISCCAFAPSRGVLVLSGLAAGIIMLGMGFWLLQRIRNKKPR